MTARVKLEIAGAVLAVVLIALVFGSWLGAREEGIRLKATLDAQNQVISAASKSEADRDAALKDTLGQLQTLQKATQTPQEVVRQLPSVLPLPQPITLNLPANPPQGGGSQASPQTPPDATIPGADLKPLFDALTACREDQAKLATATADAADDKSKIVALTTERDAAVTAAKGGSKWSRIKRGAKWFAIGAAVGGLAALAHGK